MDLKLKDILEDASEAVVTLWHISEGTHVTEGQDIVEIATDKATFDVPSPVTGRLSRIAVPEGGKFHSDDVIAEIET